MSAYVVEGLDSVRLDCGDPLQSMDWMSPYVWRGVEGLWMMMRGVPQPREPNSPTGIIWCGRSADGLCFDMDERPAIVPGPDAVDGGGVEDPTVHVTDEGLRVFYTGVAADRDQGSLLVATGPDIHRLEKRAVTLEAPRGQGNIKEATLAQAPDKSWRLFYEFARDDASRIAVASSPRLGAEWTPLEELIPVREDSWDNWHLSTGPIVQCPGRDPVMFYNGATHDARWRIGWITFNPGFTRITGRGEEPLIMPPPATDRAETDIAFAASCVVQEGGDIHLYYSLEDRMLARATVRYYD